MKSLFQKLVCAKKKKGKRLFFKYHKTPLANCEIAFLDWFSEDYLRSVHYSLRYEDWGNSRLKGLHLNIERYARTADGSGIPIGRRIIIPLSHSLIYRYWILPRKNK